MRTLTGHHKRNLAMPRLSCFLEVETARIFHGHLLRIEEFLRCLSQSLKQLVYRRGNNCHSYLLTCKTIGSAHVVPPCEIPQRVALLAILDRLVDGFFQGLHLSQYIISACAAESKQLARPLREAWRCMPCSRRAVLFQHCMEIGATKTKRAYTCTKRCVCTIFSRLSEPWTSLAVNVEGTCLKFACWVGDVHTNCRRQHFVMQSLSHLDHRCQTSGALGVSNHRLHRPDGTLADLSCGAREDFIESFYLCLVTSYGAGAMCFDQTNTVRFELRVFIRAIEGEHLALRSRCRKAQVLTVARTTHAANNSIDSVAIFLRIGQAAKHEHRDALGNHDTISCCIKGSAPSAWRECMGLAEAEVIAWLIVSIGRGKKNNITGAKPQFVDCRMQGSKR